MLFSLGIIASDMSGTEFQVFKAFEVHELIKHNYPVCIPGMPNRPCHTVLSTTHGVIHCS